jgi:hypothetical protein
MTSTPADFQYTEDERRAMAAAVPDATWLADVKDDWTRKVRFPDAERFLADKVGHVSNRVEWAARWALQEEGWREEKPSEELRTVSEIANHARVLLRLLKKPNRHRPNFAISFFGRHFVGTDLSGDGLYKAELLQGLLAEIVEDEASVRENVRASQTGDILSQAKNVAVVSFVSQLLVFWNVWTGGAAGRGTQGGPAARFVCAATNPLLSFAETRMGKTLRRGGMLDEASAAQLIRSLAP